nr:COP1-interactive protein 1 [Tanacetum cinerariifolium]
MRKHRFRTKLKSIVGSLVDPDRDEELKGSNI